jgi:hypothetical protein
MNCARTQLIPCTKRPIPPPPHHVVHDTEGANLYQLIADIGSVPVWNDI